MPVVLKFLRLPEMKTIRNDHDTRYTKTFPPCYVRRLRKGRIDDISVFLDGADLTPQHVNFIPKRA